MNNRGGHAAAAAADTWKLTKDRITVDKTYS